MKKTSGYGSHTWDGFFSHLLDEQEAQLEKKVVKFSKQKEASVPGPEHLEKVTQEHEQRGNRLTDGKEEEGQDEVQDDDEEQAQGSQ